jgi:cell division protein FtsZ
MAVSSPLLEASIDGAHGVLLSIAGGSDLGLFEVSAAANLIQEAAHEDANIIFGTVIDDALGDEVRVTVIAAGFEGGQLPRRQPGITRSADLRAPAQRTNVVSQPQPTGNHQNGGHPAEVPTGLPGNPFVPGSPAPIRQTPLQPSRSVVTDDDDLDVPDFLK